MTIIEFNAYRIVEVTDFYSEITGKTHKLVSIGLGIGKAPPFPSEVIDSTKIPEIKAAFDTYVKKAEASGLQLSLTARVKSGRKPNGFDKADLKVNVNI